MVKQEDDYKCETCTFGERGQVCSLHGVEVERRKNTYKLVEALRATVDALTQWRYITAGVGMLGVLFISGAYYFTADTKFDINTNAARLEGKVEVLATQVSSLATAMAVSEARHNALLAQLESLTRTIKTKNQQAEYDPQHARGDG